MATELIPSPVSPRIGLRIGLPDKPTADQFNTWNMQERFLEAYAQVGGVYKAAAQSGCSARAFENWHRADVFGMQNRFQEAQRQYLEKMEAEADRRGIEGVDKPVYYLGDQVGTYKVYSDNLLMFRMKKLDPSYRENAVVEEKLDEVKGILDELRRVGVPRIVDGQAHVVDADDEKATLPTVLDEGIS